jgi:hypothetical protein
MTADNEPLTISLKCFNLLLLVMLQSLGVSDPRQVDLLLKTFYTGRRNRLTQEEQQAIADIALRSGSTYEHCT